MKVQRHNYIESIKNIDGHRVIIKKIKADMILQKFSEWFHGQISKRWKLIFAVLNEGIAHGRQEI